ncbi:MAG: signal peptidase II [Psychromonas sp.]|jgi:signal peptidase II
MAEIIEKSGLRWLWLAAIMLVLDQLTKYWTIQSLDLYESYQIFSFFSFTHARNYGAAFSFLGDAGGWQRYLFTGIAIIVSSYLVYLLKKNSSSERWINCAYALILSGALGNVVDRVMLGYVVDFLDFDLGFYRWPTFNIADIAIFIGAAMMIFESLFAKQAKPMKEPKGNKNV